MCPIDIIELGQTWDIAFDHPRAVQVSFATVLGCFFLDLQVRFVQRRGEDLLKSLNWEERACCPAVHLRSQKT